MKNYELYFRIDLIELKYGSKNICIACLWYPYS